MGLPANKSSKQILLILYYIILYKLSTKDLQKLISRLVQVSIIILGSLLLLPDLRNDFYSTNNRFTMLNNIYIQDLKLLIQITKCSIVSFPISRLVLYLLNKIHFTGTSKYALSRFSLQSSKIQNYILLHGILDITLINY